MSIPTEKQITEWLLDASQHMGELQKVAAAYRRQEREERNLDLVRSKLDKTTDQIAESTASFAAKNYISVRAMESSIAATDKLTVSSSKMFQSFTDVYSAGRVMIGVIEGLTGSFTSLLSEGQEVGKMWAASSMDISGARDATKGFISDAELLKASNKAVAFDLGLTADQFASLAKGAVVASQKIGGDVVKSIDDLMTGMSRQSKQILDNLGIQVSLNDAQGKYAKQLGITTQELTEADKKQAFLNATIADLQRIAGDTKLEVESLGDSYTVLSNNVSNVVSSFSMFVASSAGWKNPIKDLTSLAKDASEAFRVMSDPRNVRQLEISQELATMSEHMVELRGQIDFTNREWKSGFEPIFSADEKLAEALSFRNKYEALQREFTRSRVAKEKEASDSEYNAWLSGQKKIAQAQIEAFEMQEAGQKARSSSARVGKESADALSAEFTKALSPAFNALASVGSAMQSANAQLQQFTTMGRLASWVSGKWKGLTGFLGGASGDLGVSERLAKADAARAAAMAKLAADKETGWANESKWVAQVEENITRLTAAYERLNAIKLAGQLGTSEYYQTIAALDSESAALAKNTEDLEGFRTVAKNTTTDLYNMAVGALATFTAGLWAAAAAAVKGEKDIGQAVAEIAEQTLLGVAAQATVKAIFEAAEAIAAAAGYRYGEAAMHTTAAGLYAAVAVLAGAGGLAIAASGASSSSSAASSTATSSTAATPTYGTQVEDTRDINVNVYLGDPTDPGQVLLMEKQIRAMVA